ncbi:hypothetical protein D3C81_2166750 [compost metagenome]
MAAAYPFEETAVFIDRRYLGGGNELELHDLIIGPRHARPLQKGHHGDMGRHDVQRQAVYFCPDERIFH